jgi:3-oxoacyl-[acyl-carrier protein] reductase
MTVALVTGGSGGIGRACAEKLSRSHDVAVHYHTDESSAAKIADKINSESENQASIYQCDLSDLDSVLEMVSEVREEIGQINTLVNNAGIGTKNSIHDCSYDHIDRLISVNLEGTIYCTKAVLPDMMRENPSHIINVSSTAGLHGSRRDPVYGASKGGMIAFSKSLARAYTSENIFSNVVSPGPTETKMYPSENIPEAEENIRIGRLIQPEEIATAVKFFSETTSISGKVLEVDGGRDI